MPDETLLGFDFGLKRIGVAIGTWAENGRLQSSRALTTIAAEDNTTRFTAISTLIAQWQATRLVVGEPRHMDGTEHELTARCIRFSNQLHGRFKLPVDRIDERLSSVEAESALATRRSATGAGGRAGTQIKQRIDAEAARVILERWMAQQTTSPTPTSQTVIP